MGKSSESEMLNKTRLHVKLNPPKCIRTYIQTKQKIKLREKQNFTKTNHHNIIKRTVKCNENFAVGFDCESLIGSRQKNVLTIR